MISRIPDDFINGGDSVTGSSALTTTGAVPFVASPGVLTQDAYFLAKTIASTPVAGDTFNRVNLTDSAPPSGGYYDTNAGYDLSIRRTYTGLTYTPGGGSFLNSLGALYTHTAFNFAAPVADDYCVGYQNEVEVPAGSTQAVSYLEGIATNVANSGSGTVASMDGLYFSAFNYGGAVGVLRGIYGGAAHFGSGNVTDIVGMSTEGYTNSAATITSSTGSVVYSGNAGGGGSIGTAFGIRNRFDNDGTITTAYAYRSEKLGATAPGTAWDISAETGWNSRILGNLAVGPLNSAAPADTLYVKDATATTGATSVTIDIGAGQTNTSTVLTLSGVLKYAGQNTTGAKSAALGANCPAVTETAPYTWFRMVASNGSTVYLPAWK